MIGLCECSHAFFLSMFLLMLPFPHDAQGEMSAKIVFRSMLLREPLQEPFKNCVKCGNWKVISRSEFKLQPSKLQVGQLFLSLRKMTAQGNCRTSFVGGLLMVYSCELYWLVWEAANKLKVFQARTRGPPNGMFCFVTLSYVSNLCWISSAVLTRLDWSYFWCVS